MPRIKVDDVEPDQNTSLEKAAGNVSKKKVVSEPVVESGGQSPVDAQIEEKSSRGILSAFIAHPPGIFFSDREPNEELILLLRAHIITTVPWIAATIVLMVLPTILLPLLGSAGILTSIGPGMTLVLTILWFLLTFTYAFVSFLYWYFNVYIVTNERVIDIDWYSVIFRKVSSTQILKIQDVNASQGGVLAGIFDYGDVQIQTAGTEENFEFTAIPHPQLVAKKIEELMEREERELEKEPVL